MNVKLKYILWKKKAGKDGSAPIYLRITYGGQTYYNTGVKSLPEHWDGDKLTEDAPHAFLQNAKLKKIVSKLETEVLNRELQGQILTLSDIKGILSPNVKSESFIKFYRAYIDNLKATNKKAKGTIAIWETEYAKFKEYAGDISFSRISSDFLDKYHQSLMTYKPTTIHKKLKKILQICHLAIRGGHMQASQIAEFEMIPYEAPDKDYLTLDETERITNAIYKGKLDHDPTFKTVACFFIIECYAGIRFSDWKRFEVEKLIHDQNLKVRAKKNGEPVYIPLKENKRLARMLGYIAANNIVFTYSEKTTNALLKMLGHVPGINITKKITTHTGRHTCGTLLGELGHNTDKIAEVLAISEATARTYRKSTRQGLNTSYKTHGGL